MRHLSTLLLVAGLTACGSYATDASGPSSDGAAPEREFAELELDLPQRGTALPEFGGETLDGTPVSLATIQGKTALINHWFYG